MSVSYKPIYIEPTSRGGAMLRDQMQKEGLLPEQVAYSEREIDYLGGMTREEREALEAERLRELQNQQTTAVEYYGPVGMPLYEAQFYGSPLVYDAPYRSQFDIAGDPFLWYKPPSGWDYEQNVPEITYYEYFGEPSLEDLDFWNNEYKQLIESDVLTEAEKEEVQQRLDAFNNGEVDPMQMLYRGRYTEFIVGRREEREEFFEEQGMTDYNYSSPANLYFAKEEADYIFDQYINNILESDSSTELEKQQAQEILDSGGAPSFNTAEEIQQYYTYIDEGHVGGTAALLQKEVMLDFFDRNPELNDTVFDHDSAWDTSQLYQTANPNIKVENASTVQMNTGTLVGAPTRLDLTKEVVNVGGFGTFNNYSYNYTDYSGLNFVDVIGVVASVAFPAYAPAISGALTIAQGGDIEDALKSAGMTWVGQQISAAGFDDKVVDFYNDIGIDLTTLPDPVQKVIIDTSKEIIKGNSGTDALKEGTIDALVDAIDVDFDLDLEGINFETPEALKELEDKIKQGLEVVDNVIVDPIDEVIDTFGSEVVDPALQNLGEAADKIIDPIDEAIDTFGSEVVDPTLQAIGEAGEAIIDPIDEAIDTFGSEVVDPALQAGSDVLSEVEDWAKEAGYIIDDLVDWERLLKLLLADKGGKTLTPIEGLFKDELYQGDLKESPDKIVSDDEIAKILNFNNTTNQKANPLLSGLFSKPKTIAEQQEENSNRRAEIRSNLLKSSKDKASGLFSI